MILLVILSIVVAISFDKFRSVHPALCDVDEFDDDDDDSGDNEEAPQHHSPNNTSHNGKKKRSKRSSETTPTKHDAYICGRRNVRNMEKVTLLLPPVNGCIVDIIIVF